MPYLKSLTFAACLSTALGTLPALAGETNSPWHSFISLQGGLYDVSDTYLAAVEGGLGYETGPLVHYLFVGAGEVNRNDKPASHMDFFGGTYTDPHAPDLQEFEIGYRLTCKLNERITAFAELGYETLNGDISGIDAL